MNRFTFKKLGRVLVLAAVIVAMLVGTVSAQQKGIFTDIRDGQKYKTVKIGTQTWMAENLNYKPTETSSRCNDCKKYGRLYTQYEAEKVCPNGWRLPDTADWNMLTRTVGGKWTETPRGSYDFWEGAGKKLKAKNDWSWNDDDNVTGNGTDNYGFSALPGGRTYRSSADEVGQTGTWWTTTKDSVGEAKMCTGGARAYSNLCHTLVYTRSMSYKHNNVDGSSINPNNDYSVRCIKTD